MGGGWSRPAAISVALLVAALPATACSSPADARPPANVANVATDAASSPAKPAAPPAPWSVAAENRRAGTPGWQLTRLGSQHDVEGWLDHTSIETGGRVGLHVSTTAGSYTVHAIRVGYYGGAQGREIWHSDRLPGVRQPAATIVAPTHTVTTNWPVSLTVDTAGWPPGQYLFRLDASTGSQRYVPLVIRRPSAAGTVVVVSADTTWQAYNDYGGYSLYHGPDGRVGSRARAVSFDRPYSISVGQGVSEYFENMHGLVLLVEKLGLDADYVSDVDLHRQPGLLEGARAVVMTGHDEYWSLAMRSALLQARDAGVNIAFLGANTGYRHIRFEPSAAGTDRIEVCYKNPAEDPLSGRNDPDVTGQWRYAPDPRPESVLTGVYYRGNPVRADMIVVDPGAWMLAGTRATAGLRLPGVVGEEYDRVDLNVPTPRPIEVISHSPVAVRGRPDFADSAYYTTAGGAGVFTTGTIGWIFGLTGAYGPRQQAFVTKVTENVLRAFARGPAGRDHPARDNVADIYPRGPGAPAPVVG